MIAHAAPRELVCPIFLHAIDGANDAAIRLIVRVRAGLAVLGDIARPWRAELPRCPAGRLRRDRPTIGTGERIEAEQQREDDQDNRARPTANCDPATATHAAKSTTATAALIIDLGSIQLCIRIEHLASSGAFCASARIRCNTPAYMAGRIALMQDSCTAAIPRFAKAGRAPPFSAVSALAPRYPAEVERAVRAPPLRCITPLLSRKNIPCSSRPLRLCGSISVATPLR